jgi:Fic family protein
MFFDRHQPFNSLPPLPPTGVELETPAILKKATAAHRPLAELKGAAAVLPNPRILVDGIALQEARFSSEIEQIVTTSDELYRAAAGGGAEPNPYAKEVVRYREALWHGCEVLGSRPLATNLFVELMQIIKGTRAGIRSVPGTRVLGSDGEIIYTPPEGETLIRDKLGDLERFLHEEDNRDPLVKMAVAHYQFEAIHPFIDGNGRAGRIINILFLIEKGLLDIPVLYLSRYIIDHKGEYYDRLRAVTEQQRWEPWIMYMLSAVEESAARTRKQIAMIASLMDETQERIRLELPKIYSKDLVEVIFQHPYCKIKFLERAGIAKRQTAASYLRQLEELEILRSEKHGRDVYFINTRLIAALSAS